jgi:hypothetical protein
MAASFAYPLAQLVDLLPNWAWYALFAGGMLAPLVGLMASLGMRTLASWKRTAVGTFYVVSLPLAGWVFLGGTENPAGVCSFILLMPVGMIVGLVVLPGRRPEAGRPGFEVVLSEPKDGPHRAGH